MGQSFRVLLCAAAGVAAFAGAATAQNDPPSQAGRLAYTEGTVSFHDDEQTGWSPAVVNTPLTSGDSIWTEPNARSEISVAGTRVRMDGSTQLNLLELNDRQTRLQVGQGRVDIKTFSLNPNTPYQVVTPRGTINLRQQGDYYVEAGSTQDATRLGVRAGAAQFQSLNGQTLTITPGQVGEIFGDSGALQMRTLNAASPAQPTYWAARDRQINYDLPTQYLSPGITGYEDLNAYGNWSNDSQYGNVWTPRSTPAGWQPYKNGHWSYVKPWGWTWVDDQPWGYAPSHYGRWANRNNQWVWVPPQRDSQPVYAPALVDFIGGIQLVQALLGGGSTLGTQNTAPVGWFPLGPREAYVPSYSTDRAYYTRLNSANQVQQQALEDRWQRAQRREAYIAGQNAAMSNQRFTTVIPSSVFVGSQPVARAALKVSPAQIAAAPVAPVAAPPAPTASLAVAAPASTPPAKTTDPKGATPAPAPDPKAEADAKAKAEAQAKAGANANLPVAKTTVADMPTLGKPTTTPRPAAPGPKLATAPNSPAAVTNPTGSTPAKAPDKASAPPLVPRTGAAPPVLKDDGKAPAAPQAKAPSATDTKPPAAPSTPPQAPPAGATPPAAKATEPVTPIAPPGAQQARPETAKPATPAVPAVPQQAKPEAGKPAEPGKPPPPQAAQPATPAVPPQLDNKAPDKGAAVTPKQPSPPAAPAVQPPKPPSPPEQKIAVPQPPAIVPPVAGKPDKADDKKDEPATQPPAGKPDDKK